MSEAEILRIQADELKYLEARLSLMPPALERARRRALKKLSTYVQRQVLREAAKAADVTQKLIKSLLRFRASLKEDSLGIWLGLNPIPVHYLGTVTWSRKMPGAKVGARSFPGSWSWKECKVKGLEGKVMRRTGADRLPIEKVTLPIYTQVQARLQAILPDIRARHEKLLLQEMRYALIEGAR